MNLGSGLIFLPYDVHVAIVAEDIVLADGWCSFTVSATSHDIFHDKVGTRVAMPSERVLRIEIENKQEETEVQP